VDEEEAWWAKRWKRRRCPLPRTVLSHAALRSHVHCVLSCVHRRKRSGERIQSELPAVDYLRQCSVLLVFV
jgi:hypothetical protein